MQSPQGLGDPPPPAPCSSGSTRPPPAAQPSPCPAPPALPQPPQPPGTQQDAAPMHPPCTPPHAETSPEGKAQGPGVRGGHARLSTQLGPPGIPPTHPVSPPQAWRCPHHNPGTATGHTATVRAWGWGNWGGGAQAPHGPKRVPGTLWGVAQGRGAGHSHTCAGLGVQGAVCARLGVRGGDARGVGGVQSELGACTRVCLRVRAQRLQQLRSPLLCTDTGRGGGHRHDTAPGGWHTGRGGGWLQGGGTRGRGGAAYEPK